MPIFEAICNAQLLHAQEGCNTVADDCYNYKGIKKKKEK